MRNMITSALLILTATVTALIAGLFYAYSCSVNIGLHKLSDEGYLSAMQSINKEILNPLFFMSFIGTLVLLPISSYINFQQPLSARFIFLVLATIVYTTGTFGVTILGNVPLNEALAQFDIQEASAEEIAAQRLRFEHPWNKLHNIRTIASVVALLLVLIACVKNGPSQD